MEERHDIQMDLLMRRGYRLEFMPPPAWDKGDIEIRHIRPHDIPGKGAILVGHDLKLNKYYIEDTEDNDFKAYIDDRLIRHADGRVRFTVSRTEVFIGFACIIIDTEKGQIIQTKSGYPIQAARLTYYPTRSAKSIIKEATFHICPGEFTALVGPSGSGKSTILRILSGMLLHYPSNPILQLFLSRRGRFGGETNLAFRGRHKYRRIAFVTQQDFLPGKLRVMETIEYRLQQHDRTDVTAHKIGRHLQLLGLKSKENTFVGKLSGGERRRLSVIMEVLFRPALLLLDEPFAGLDPESIRLMHSYLRLLKGQTTVICTTHIFDHMDTFDRIIMLKGGSLVFDERVEDVEEDFSTIISRHYDPQEET